MSESESSPTELSSCSSVPFSLWTIAVLKFAPDSEVEGKSISISEVESRTLGPCRRTPAKQKMPARRSTARRQSLKGASRRKPRRSIRPSAQLTRMGQPGTRGKSQRPTKRTKQRQSSTRSLAILSAWARRRNQACRTLAYGVCVCLSCSFVPCSRKSTGAMLRRKRSGSIRAKRRVSVAEHPDSWLRASVATLLRGAKDVSYADE
jgi:hypothetical protein